MNPSVNDSTKTNERALAFLTDRWGDAAIVDSVAAGPKTFFIQMRGRYQPITCVEVESSAGPSCQDGRPLWSRLFH